jgi:hypothetical protein
MIETFLTLPIGIRFSLLLLICFLIWCMLGRLVLMCLSLVPLLVKYVLIGLYLVLEIPVSALHRRCGGIFGSADRKLAGFFRKVTSVFGGLTRILQNPQYPYRIAILIVLVLSAYLIIPQLFGLEGDAFVFWHGAYTRFEDQLVAFFNRQDWIHRLVVYQ